MTLHDQEASTDVLSLVQRFARRCTHDPQESEDLAQVTMIKAWLAWKPAMQEWSDPQVSSWLYQTMRNEWIDTVRRKACRPVSDELKDTHTASADLERDVERREMIRLVFSHLTQTEQALLISYAQGPPCKEMAKCYGVHPNTIHKRLCYARKAFRREWEKVAA